MLLISGLFKFTLPESGSFTLSNCPKSPKSAEIPCAATLLMFSTTDELKSIFAEVLFSLVHENSLSKLPKSDVLDVDCLSRCESCSFRFAVCACVNTSNPVRLPFLFLLSIFILSLNIAAFPEFATVPNSNKSVFFGNPLKSPIFVSEASIAAL